MRKNLDIKAIILKEYKISVQKTLSSAVANDIKMLHHAAQDMHYEVISLIQSLPSEVMDFRIEFVRFECPADTWQMFKSQYLPLWFIDIWPVKMHVDERQVKFERLAIFPKLQNCLDWKNGRATVYYQDNIQEGLVGE